MEVLFAYSKGHWQAVFDKTHCPNESSGGMKCLLEVSDKYPKDKMTLKYESRDKERNYNLLLFHEIVWRVRYFWRDVMIIDPSDHVCAEHEYLSDLSPVNNGEKLEKFGLLIATFPPTAIRL